MLSQQLGVLRSEGVVNTRRDDKHILTRSPTLLQWTSLRCAISSTARMDKPMTID
jgi:hypothetical protein